MHTPRFLPRWMVYLLFALSLSAFVYSLQVRHQDWVGVTAEAPQ